MLEGLCRRPVPDLLYLRSQILKWSLGRQLSLHPDTLYIQFFLRLFGKIPVDIASRAANLSLTRVPFRMELCILPKPSFLSSRWSCCEGTWRTQWKRTRLGTVQGHTWCRVPGRPRRRTLADTELCSRFHFWRFHSSLKCFRDRRCRILVLLVAGRILEDKLGIPVGSHCRMFPQDTSHRVLLWERFPARRRIPGAPST